MPRKQEERQEDEGLIELFKTALVAFETLHKKGQQDRAERLRVGILKAEKLCRVDLAGPEFRFLTPSEGPWYGE